MTGENFIKSHIALKAWQDGIDYGISGMLGVAFVLRYRIRAGWWGGDWIALLSHHEQYLGHKCSQSELPDPRHPTFQVLLQEVDGIFSGQREDNILVAQDPIRNSISTSVAPPPPLYYARPDQITNDWFLKEICGKPEHKRTASVGLLVFYT